MVFMEIYTFQLAKWRKVKELGVPYINTTIKSGEWRLAPTWNLLMAYRNDLAGDDDYTTVYNALLKERYEKEPEYFNALCNMDAVAFGCYCSHGKFCHRHLLVKFFESITEVVYRGEIK